MCEDGKRPDGASLIPWSKGKCLACDVTVPNIYTDSYLTATATAVGSAASEAAIYKAVKYVSIASKHHFLQVAIETTGVFDNESEEFLQQVEHRCTDTTDDPNETSTCSNNYR